MLEKLIAEAREIWEKECFCDDKTLVIPTTFNCKYNKKEIADFWESRLREAYKAGKRDERERINQYFADKATYDTETENTIISEKTYNRAFNPDEVTPPSTNTLPT